MTTKEELKSQKWTSDLVGALTDPIICWPGYEDDRPPETYKTAITLQRLIENLAAIKENREPLATDAEAAWYLSTTSLSQPLSENWTRIYMYCFTRTMEGMKKEVPAELRVDQLSDYDLNYHLLPLKRWLYQSRTEGRLTRERTERKSQAEERRQGKGEMQPALFQF